MLAEAVGGSLATVCNVPGHYHIIGQINEREAPARLGAQSKAPGSGDAHCLLPGTRGPLPLDVWLLNAGLVALGYQGHDESG